MIQRLLLGFVWKTITGFSFEKINELVEKEYLEYILEVDVNYPKDLYKMHKSCHFQQRES